MKEFDVYEHPTLGRRIVKKGFCWPACIFNFWWAFFKGMWAHGVAFIAVGLVLSLVAFALPDARAQLLVYSFVMISFAWVVGDFAREWRTKNLKKRGFKPMKTVKAETKDAAIVQLAQSDSN